MNNIQEIVEKSIFKVINDVFYNEGYSVNYQDLSNPIFDPNTGPAAYKTATDTIKSSRGFFVSQYGPGNSFAKDIKLLPRIVIEPEMILVGDIAYDPYTKIYEPNPNDPQILQSYNYPYDTTDLNIDIHLVFQSAQQSRVLHALMAKAIGTRAFIPLYNDNSQRFFIYQFNYYSLPDPQEGVNEKVYSYQIKDLYLTEINPVDTNVPLIKEIKLDIETMKIEGRENLITGYLTKDSMIITFNP